MIIPLSNEVAVNPSQVADLVIDGNRIVISMVGGRTHSLPCEYGKSIFRTRDDILKRLNGEAE